jgi:hypothetical protein
MSLANRLLPANSRSLEFVEPLDSYSFTGQEFFLICGKAMNSNFDEIVRHSDIGAWTASRLQTITRCSDDC